jgi:hypothetical protein
VKDNVFFSVALSGKSDVFGVKWNILQKCICSTYIEGCAILTLGVFDSVVGV